MYSVMVISVNGSLNSSVSRFPLNSTDCSEGPAMAQLNALRDGAWRLYLYVYIYIYMYIERERETYINVYI